MSIARHGWAFPKCSKIGNFQFVANGWSYCFDFMHDSKFQPSQSVSQSVSQLISQLISQSGSYYYARKHTFKHLLKIL